MHLINVLIQVAAGSRERRLYNEKTLEHLGTRETARPYPYPYGFVLGTKAEDNDNVDCYVITTESLEAGTIVECEPIGLLEQDENGDIDHKILAGLPGQEVNLGDDLRLELEDFIQALFARFPGASVRVGRILPREAALQHLEASRDA